MKSTRFLQLKYGEGRVIEPFLQRLYAEKNLRTVYWISPWITHLNFRTGTTLNLLRRFKIHKVNLAIITREPDPGSAHAQFLMDVKLLPTASVFFMPLLHAKFYVAVAREKRYALLGSANMYEWSGKSYDLGVAIEARGDGELLVEKLEGLANALRVAGTRVQKWRKEP